MDPRTSRAELDVTAVLDASFQRAGERFRATARLVEAPGGRRCGPARSTSSFEDIFEVQDQVAHGIATALTARLTHTAFTPSPLAYDLYLRSRDAARAGGLVASTGEALALLERAVEVEPRYADAWAFTRRVGHSMADSGIDPDPRWFALAEEAMRRALELEPGNAQAQFPSG